MDRTPIKAGMSLETEQLVTAELSAPHLGSGALRVYATPAMAMFVEQSCCKLIHPLLADEQTTVGIEINVRHLAPTPVGMRVYARVDVVSVEGNLVAFRADLRDELERIGEVEHRRAIVSTERFMKRVGSKSKPGEE
jgi:predicted thioesterase